MMPVLVFLRILSVTRSHGEIMSDYGAASRVNSPPPPPPSPNGSTATSTVTGAAARLSEEGGEGSPVEMEVDGNGGEGREGTEGHENMKDEMMGEQRRCRSVSVGESTRAEEVRGSVFRSGGGGDGVTRTFFTGVQFVTEGLRSID